MSEKHPELDMNDLEQVVGGLNRGCAGTPRTLERAAGLMGQFSTMEGRFGEFFNMTLEDLMSIKENDPRYEFAQMLILWFQKNSGIRRDGGVKL